MQDKKALIVCASILVGLLGASSLAHAGSDREDMGGYRIGPLGQVLGTPTEWGARSRSAGRTAYGFAPQVSHRTARSRKRGETYIDVQDEFFRESNGE